MGNSWITLLLIGFFFWRKEKLYLNKEISHRITVQRTFLANLYAKVSADILQKENVTLNGPRYIYSIFNQVWNLHWHTNLAYNGENCHLRSSPHDNVRFIQISFLCFVSVYIFISFLQILPRNSTCFFQWLPK